MTPEGKAKDEIKAFLRARKVASLTTPMPDAVGYYHMPMGSGYGSPSLDFIGCYRSFYFAIEAKAEGGKATARQNLIMDMVVKAGGIAIADDKIENVLKYLTMWFDHWDTIASKHVLV